MPIYKRCSRCGKRVDSGSTCQCIKERHKEYDRYSRDRESKGFYSGKEWKRARLSALELDEGIDVYLFMTQGEVVVANTVHHIIPLRTDKRLGVELTNLMSLNHNTHSEIEKKYKNNESEMMSKLSHMLMKYREGVSEKFQ